VNLYEINSEYSRVMRDVMEYAEQNEGSLTKELEMALDGIEIERSEKIENTVLLMKNLDSEAEMIKAEESKLYARRKSCEKRSESVRSWLRDNLEGEEIKTSKFAITWRKSESVEVDIPAEQLPVHYQNIKTVVTADKTLLKSALKSGEIIEGVYLNAKMNMQVK